jgi:hypothetical protein
MKPQRGRDLVTEEIPDLSKGPGKTTSNAMHNIRFIGILRIWNDFEKEVMEAYDQHDWHKHQSILAYRPSGVPGNNHSAREQVHVGDEHGLQGRFQQHIGQIMTSIFKSQGMDLSFCDFKCALGDYSKTPDVAIIDNTGRLKLLGELKVPWAKAHRFKKTISDLAVFRRALG